MNKWRRGDITAHHIYMQRRRQQQQHVRCLPLILIIIKSKRKLLRSDFCLFPSSLLFFAPCYCVSQCSIHCSNEKILCSIFGFDQNSSYMQWMWLFVGKMRSESFAITILNLVQVKQTNKQSFLLCRMKTFSIEMAFKVTRQKTREKSHHEIKT